MRWVCSYGFEELKMITVCLARKTHSKIHYTHHSLSDPLLTMEMFYCALGSDPKQLQSWQEIKPSEEVSFKKIRNSDD